MIWIGVAICLLISFTFSGIEAGILSVNRVRLRHHLKAGDKAAIKLNRLLSRPERLLVTVILVTSFMNIYAMVLSTQEAVRLMGMRGYVVACLVSLPVYLFGFELLPKSLFRRFPYRALATVSELLRLTDILLSPVLWIGARVQDFLLGENKAQERKLFVAREDFKYLTIESEREGTLTKVEREMIHNVVDFRAVTARDVMTPIENVRTVRSDAATDELLALARTHDLDRLPIVSESGEITGLVNVLEVLIERNKSATAGAFQRRIVRVTEDAQAYQVIQKLRAARVSLAVVLDAAGKAIGIVNAEDVLSKLVRTAVA